MANILIFFFTFKEGSDFIKTYCVYKIQNLINNKIYIGQTSRPPAIRFNEHLNNKKEILGQAGLKYGKDNFILEILEENIKEQDIDDKERSYIKQYNSLTPNGYNLSKGGQSNKSISDNGRLLLREKNLGIKNPRCKYFILMIDVQTNQVLNKFGSAREAGRFLGNENRYRAIVNCLQNKQKQALGYIWKYDKEN